MAHANNVLYVAQGKFQKLVRQYAGSIRKSKQRVIRENCPQPHCPRMQNSFMAEATQACVAVHDLNLLSDNDVSVDWEE